MNDFFFIVLVLIAFFVVTIGLCMGVVTYDCGRYSDATGRKTKTEFGTCYVQINDGTYVAREELRAVEKQ